MFLEILPEILSLFSDIPFDWDWQTFWPGLAAGLITFLVGVPYAFLLLWFQHSREDRREFKRFKELAHEMLDEFAELDQALKAWGESRARGQRIVPLNAPETTWEIDDSIRALFSSRGVQLTTHAAVSWYREAANSARDWNNEIAKGSPSDDTSRLLTSRIPAARSKIGAAIESIQKAAGLGVKPVKNNSPQQTHG